MRAKKAKNCSSKKQELFAEREAEKSAERWKQYAPTFRLSEIKLSELCKRPKNAKKDIEAANTTILRMSNIQPDACSMRLVDSDGKTMIAVFSHRMSPDGKKEDSKLKVFFSPHFSN